ncbi:MAG: glycosyl hydrolase [Pseudomonadota bacterium]
MTHFPLFSAGKPYLMAALCVLLCSETLAGATPPATVDDSPATRERVLIIGQDLDAIRGYMAADCCATPDALTAYLNFYNLLVPDNYGGLGIDEHGKELPFEFSWGAGAVSAYETVTAFGVNSIAIGLSITENEHPGQLAKLIEGEHDDNIRQLARFAELVDGTVYLRIGYEFDGAWNDGYGDAQQYIGAFRRIVDVLRDEGADNVEYVLQASAAGVDEVIDGVHEDIADWYPGDEYVDWMGLSWFMNPDERTVVEMEGFTPLSPGELSDEVLALARAHGKPVMIAEASPQAFDLKERFTAHHTPIWDGEALSDKRSVSNDDIWNYWFVPLFAYMDQNADVIRALAYINVDWDSQPMWGPPYGSGFWGDTRLETNPDLAERFNKAVAAWKQRE